VPLQRLRDSVTLISTFVLYCIIIMNLRQMIANFKICFTGKLSTKFIAK